MCTRREACLKAASFMTVLAARAGAREKSGQVVSVPFDFAAGRGSLLVGTRVNRRVALMILDTGSTHTIVRPSLVGVDRSELARPQSSDGVIGDALGAEVTLEMGGRVWQRRRIAVMDLSAVLSAYHEKVDGLLGLDLLLEFSQVLIDWKARRVTLTP